MGHEKWPPACRAVRNLKAERDGELQVHGSGALVRWLLDNDLVDELNLFIFRRSSARARGSSPTPVPTPRSNWSNHGPPPEE